MGLWVVRGFLDEANAVEIGWDYGLGGNIYEYLLRLFFINYDDLTFLIMMISFFYYKQACMGSDRNLNLFLLIF